MMRRGMTKRPAKPSTEKDASILARLPMAIHGHVGTFFSDVDDVLLKRAGGSQSKRYYAAKVELATCIKQGDNKYNKISAILNELPYLSAFKTEALHNKLLQLNPELLQHMAFGEQDEAEKLLTDNSYMNIAQKLLTLPGTFTDYSGRTFKCTAYEYAYWAKDTHMCRMLEACMDDDTKATMLERIDSIERDGLTYEQHGHVVKHSRHFDLTPLKEALRRYVDEYPAWEAANDETAMKAAWMRVGLAQRDLPVHVVNEYCRPDRAFDPLPTFNDVTLPRTIRYFDYRSFEVESLFPLVISGSSGLGVDFALYRARTGGRQLQTGGNSSARPNRRAACLDFAAVSHLDEVRTADLMKSRKILEMASPNHDFRLS